MADLEFPVLIVGGGERISTLDLFDTSFVLLAGPECTEWRRAAEEVARDIGMPLQAYTVGPGGDLADPASVWAQTYGVESDGAVLVRPDGYVAWRNRRGARDGKARLAELLRRVLAREHQAESAERTPL